MGVKGFGQIVKKIAPNSIKQYKFSDFNGTKQAIDFYGLLYSFKIAILQNTGGKGYTTKDGRSKSHILATFSKVYSYLKYGIEAVFIYDGHPPKIKDDTLFDRRKVKANAKQQLLNNKFKNESEKLKLLKKMVSIKDIEIKESQDLLKEIGISYIQALGEAEAQCAALNKSGKVDGVVSNDYDTLLLESPIVLMNFSNKSQVTRIDLTVLLIELFLKDTVYPKLQQQYNQLENNHIVYEQKKKLESQMKNMISAAHDKLIDLCAILGHDYCSGIKGLNRIEAYEMFKKAANMENFIKHIKELNYKKEQVGKKPTYIIPTDFMKKWKNSKEYYKQVEVIDPKDPGLVLHWQRPNRDGIIKLMCDKFEFLREDIEPKVDIIISIYEQYVQNNYKLRSRFYRNRIRYFGSSVKNHKYIFNNKFYEQYSQNNTLIQYNYPRESTMITHRFGFRDLEDHGDVFLRELHMINNWIMQQKLSVNGFNPEQMIFYNIHNLPMLVH